MSKEGLLLDNTPDLCAEFGPMDERQPSDPRQGSFLSRFAECIRNAFAPGLKTSLFLLKIMLPLSLVVAILEYSGVLAEVSGFLEPVMRFIGLPGSASLAFISSIFLNLYSAIAVLGQLALSPRELTIAAIMCLTAHNMIVETTVMKKTGSSAVKMVLLRIGAAILAAWVFNLLLPPSDRTASMAAAGLAERKPLLGAALAWGLSCIKLVLKVAIIVFLLTFLQRILDEFRITEFLSAFFTPVMHIFGLPGTLSFLWIIIHTVGYAYGAGVIAEQVEQKKMTLKEGDLFNHHAAVCHSLLEDTVLFASIGVSVFWLIVPRLILALAVVWGERIRRALFMRSFRVGTM